MLRLTYVMKQLQTLSKHHFKECLQRFQIHFQCTIIAESEYIRIYQNISEYIRIYQNISEYIRIFKNLAEYIRIYQNI